MIILMIFTGFAGVLLGTIGMALITSGRSADEIHKYYVLKHTLGEVWNWYSHKPMGRFPEKDVREALKLE